MRRLSFWLSVAGVSVLANFAIEACADRVKSPGLARLVAYTHRGNG